MPFIHINACSNPVLCPSADYKMRKFWDKDIRNWEAMYMFTSHLKMHYNMEFKFSGW